MARQYKTGLIITGDASGGIKAVRATEKELGQLNKGFDRGSKRAKSFARNTGGVSREMQVLRRLAAPVGAALAGMFAVNGLRNQINFADQLQKTSIRIGASTEALSEYNHVANLAGVEFNQLTTAWQRQSRRIAQAAQDTGEAKDALALLNLDAAELARLAPEDQFERIAGAMNGVASEAQRVALAQKIWDSEGVRLLQIVNQGTDAIRAQREEAERLGLTISRDTANAMAGFNDEVTRLTAVGEGLSRQILSELVPAMTSGMQATSAWVEEMGGAAEILDTTKDVASALGAVLAGRLAGSLVTATARLTATAGAAGALRGALALVGGPIGLLVGGAGLLYAFREELGLVESASENATDALNENAQAIRNGSAAALDANYENLTNALEGVSLQAQEAMAQLTELTARQDFYENSHKGMADSVAGAIGEQEQALAGLWERQVQLQKAIEDNREERKELTSADTDGAKAADLLANGTDKLTEAQKEAQKAAKEQADSLEALRRAMNPLRAEHGEYTDRVGVLNQALADGTIDQLEYGEAVRWAADQYVRAATGAEEYEKQTKSLIQQYDQQHQKALQLEADLRAVNAAYNNPDVEMSQAQHLRMVAAIRDEMRDLALEADPMAQEMARAWEEASNRIDETFADAFTGAFGSFDDFADQLLDGFKRLLGELAYQATLKPIVVQLTGQMQGMMGGAGQGGVGGGSGGIGSMLSGGRNLLSSAQQGFGNIAWTGASNTAYAGTGFANSATSGIGQSGFMGGSTANFSGATGLASMGAGYAGGYVGSEVGGMISNKQANSNYGQMAGTAIGTYFGGPIGAGIGSALGSLADTLFGSGGSDLDIAMQRLPSSTAGDASRWDHGIVAEGGLGAVGFHEANSREVKDLWDVDQAKEVVQAIAQMDTMVAGLAQSAGELAQMRDISQGYYGETSNPGDVVDRLTARYGEVFEALDGDFGAFVRSIEGGVGDVVEQAVAGRNAFALMSGAAERLSLNIRTSGVAAYEASSQLAQLAGGVDNLSAAQQGYYQAFFSDAERAAHLQEDLAESLNAMGLALPGSRGGFRALVEAQNLNTAAGRRMYLQLLELAPAFDELAETMTDGLAQAMEDARSLADQARDSVRDAWGGFESDSLALQSSLLELAGDELGVLNMQREQEIAAMDEALRPFQRRIWALQDESAAIEAYHRELERAESQLGSTLEQIRRFVDEAQATAGSPGSNLTEAESQFERQLALAQAGDRGALQSITQYADRFMQSGQDYFASGEGFQAIQQQVLGALEALPDQLTAEEFIADEIREAMEQAQQALGGQLDGLASAALDELAELQGLHDETRRQVDQLVTIDSSVLSVRDAVLALGVAQEEIARIERERAKAEQAEKDKLAESRRAAAQQAQTQERRSELQGTIADSQALIERNTPLAQQYAERADRSEQGYWSSSYRVELDQKAQSLAGDWDAMNAFYERQQAKGNGATAAYFWNLSREYAYGNSVDDAQARIQQAQKALGDLPKFAKGGTFTGSVVNDPTLFGMGLMGEAGPEAIMPLHKGADGSLGIRAELPAFPLLGKGDVVEAIQDLKREVAGLLEENRRLTEEGNRHAAAGVNLAQAGFKRLVATGERTARSNEDLAQQARLEALR